MTLAADHPSDIPAFPSKRTRHRVPRTAAGTFGISLATSTVLAALWLVATRYHWVSPLFFPSPAEVGRQFVDIATVGYADGSLLDHVLASLGRLLSAVALGIA